MSNKKKQDVCKNASANLFHSTVILPTMVAMGEHRLEAQLLLLGTAIQESQLTFRRQIGGGPARGLFQMELKTHDDIWENYLKYNKDLTQKVEKTLSSTKADKHKELETNDKYAAAMALVHYKRHEFRTGKTIPTTINKMADHWKKYYNTPKGRGTPEKFKSNWELYCNSK